MPADRRANIILITTDQHRGDCLGLAHPVVQTPNLDWLARSGAWFPRAHTECPSCIPARFMMMTGMAPAANGLVGFKGVDMDPAHTLAGELTRAGYQTEMIGKLHLFPVGKRFGFEHMQLTDGYDPYANAYLHWLRQVHRRTEEHAHLAHGAGTNAWVGRPSHLPEEQTHTFWCINQAIAFIKRRDPTVPFFLNISFNDPHPPLTPPALYYDRYMAKDLPAPATGDWADDLGGPQKGLNPNGWKIHLDADPMKQCRAGYYGLINFIDDQIGRLIQVAAGLRDTFVVFASDHGEMLGDHHLFRKCVPYEGSSRIPLLCRGPEWMGLRSEVVSDVPVGLQDIMPTLLEVAGAPIPDTCTGRSLLPLLRGETPAWRDVLHGEDNGCYDRQDAHHFLVDHHMKYIWFTQTGRERLFDLADDPDERHDLARGDDAERRLGPYREKLIALLADRPEGFTDGIRLIAGREHDFTIPGYRPGKTFPFV
ncbi:MAG: sulfatase-like hydrolase/transferase [Planctomycetota bacterium]